MDPIIIVNPNQPLNPIHNLTILPLTSIQSSKPLQLSAPYAIILENYDAAIMRSIECDKGKQRGDRIKCKKGHIEDDQLSTDPGQI